MSDHSGEPPRVGYFPEEKAKPTPPAAGRQQASHRPRRRINPLRLGLLIACAAVFVTCAALLISYGVDLLRANRASEELRSVYHAAENQPPAATEPAAPQPIAQEDTAQDEATQTLSPTETPPQAVLAAEAPALTVAPASASGLYPGNPSLHIRDEFTALRKRNKDIIGWLTIEGLIDEAVVQRDNSYYLGRDYLGYHNVNGALFLDENCVLRTPPAHMVIHGHNMKTGAMFGHLKQYKMKGAAFYKEHPFISFDTIYEEARYVIFAVLEVSTNVKDANFVNFIGAQTLADDAAFADYVARMKALSLYQTDVDAQPGDRLLTLATCTAAGSDERMLVVARMLRDGEDEFALNQQIYMTGNK